MATLSSINILFLILMEGHKVSLLCNFLTATKTECLYTYRLLFQHLEKHKQTFNPLSARAFFGLFFLISKT